MAQSGQRKCLCCGDFFDLDHRNRERQRFCSTTECRRASKAASQAAWLAQPQNNAYFRDPVHVARVQAWRATHPGYGRAKAASPAPLQDSLIVQVADFIEELPNRGETAVAPAASALQDLLNPPSPVLAGLIAYLFEVTLQEDIAATTRRLVQLGHDVIKRSRDEVVVETTGLRGRKLRWQIGRPNGRLPFGALRRCGRMRRRRAACNAPACAARAQTGPTNGKRRNTGQPGATAAPSGWSTFWKCALALGAWLPLAAATGGRSAKRIRTAARAVRSGCARLERPDRVDNWPARPQTPQHRANTARPCGLLVELRSGGARWRIARHPPLAHAAAPLAGSSQPGHPICRQRLWPRAFAAQASAHPYANARNACSYCAGLTAGMPADLQHVIL